MCVSLGDIVLPGGVIMSMNTLICISIGGPATTVTWTRDSVTITEGNETVLNDPETAQYTHTLTVTSVGEYTCTVANNKPSTASATITVSSTAYIMTQIIIQFRNCDYIIFAKREPNICNFAIQVPHLPVM